MQQVPSKWRSSLLFVWFVVAVAGCVGLGLRFFASASGLKFRSFSCWCELASHTLTGSLVPRDLLESRKSFPIWVVVVLDREYFGKYHFYMSHML